MTAPGCRANANGGVRSTGKQDANSLAQDWQLRRFSYRVGRARACVEPAVFVSVFTIQGTTPVDESAAPQGRIRRQASCWTALDSGISRERQNLSGGGHRATLPRASARRSRVRRWAIPPASGRRMTTRHRSSFVRQVTRTRCLCGLMRLRFLTLPRAVTYHGDRFTCSGGARFHPLP